MHPEAADATLLRRQESVAKVEENEVGPLRGTVRQIPSFILPRNVDWPAFRIVAHVAASKSSRAGEGKTPWARWRCLGVHGK